MRNFIAAFLVCLYVPGPVKAASIPTGTEISVRLTTRIASDTGRAGDAVEAVIIAPVLEGNSIAIAPGTKLRGKIAELKAAAKLSDRASVKIAFTELMSLSGNVTAIQARIVDVENARESVDSSGAVVGIVAAETAAARADQGISKLAEKNSKLAGLLGLAKGALLKDEASGDIVYEPGVELRVVLTSAVEWTDSTEHQMPTSVGDGEALFGLVNAQPFQTIAAKPPKPSDITNLMFIGTEEELLAAFREAGWTTADAVNTASVIETMRAMAAMRAYKEAPMSVLLLDSKPSSYDMQKGNNTFAERHHLRIWKRPETFEGKPVWVSSSTHDIGIAFSEENRTFIHVIDSNIDKERSKVVTDLLFTGRVKGLSLVDRPQVPRTTKNATGDVITTDGHMAVMLLQ